MPNSILVLGAGELGMSVLRGLSAKAKTAATSTKATVAVLLRASTINSTDPTKMRNIEEIRRLGVNLVIGNLIDSTAGELAYIFQSYNTVISCSGFIEGKGLQTKITLAVLSAEVKIYFPWQFGVDYDVIGRGSAQDLFDEQLDVRDLLRAQNSTNWVIVSTGMFTSFLFEPSFGLVDLKRNEVNALGSWEDQVTVTSAADIGTLVADIVFTKPRIDSQVVYTAGDTISYRQLADAIDRLLGRKVQRNLWSKEFLIAELEKDPLDALKKYRAVFASGKGLAWPMESTYNVQNGIHVENVESWIRANLRA